MKRAGWLAPALAAAVALPALGNGFVYDDVAIIRDNPLVHALSWKLWTVSYWPAGGLYRPLTLQLFALEWVAGGGSPLLFHAVSLVLLALVTWSAWRLARRWLPESPALLAASLFAVHPVHVEAVANVVGQSELLVALFALVAVERFLAWSDEGRIDAPRRAALAGLTLLGILSKETGYVIPLLLVAAQATRPPAHPPIRPLALLQAAAVTAALLLRLIVLPDLSGETPSAAFYGISAGRRVVGMLQVIPHWARLLLWPAHLQAEYGPPALDPGARPGLVHAAGAAMLAGYAVLLRWSWRRAPAAAFGLIWLALALAPVSNLLTPTGIVLAERTLFLPSFGVVLAVGAIGSRLPAIPSTRLLALLLVLLAAGRSVTRIPAWASDEAFFRQMVRDAPASYRSHLMASRWYHGAGRNPEALAQARRALELYQGDPRVYEQVGQLFRVQRRCPEALPVLHDGIARFPGETIIRSRFIECALATGDTALARETAEDAIALGQTEFESTLRRLPP